MIRSMTRAGEPIGRRDVAIAVAFALLGLLLMYGNATDPVVDTVYLAMPVFLLVSCPSCGAARRRSRRSPPRSPPSWSTQRCSARSPAVA